MMTSIELFAGAGGAALGLHRAGFSCIARYEIDPVACATLEAATTSGRLDGMTFCEDVASVQWSTARQVGLVWASPPCQIHSRVNTRRRDVAFDGWPATLRAISMLRPMACVIENSADICDNGTAAKWMDDLASVGYRYRVQKIVIDAADLGLPQTRRRCFIVGTQTGPGYTWEPPRLTHAPAAVARLTGCLPHVGMRAALERQPAGLRFYTDGRGRAGSQPHRLDLPSATVTCQEVKGTRAHTGTGWVFNGGPDRASDSAYLATGQRRVTEACAAELQGFPSGWPFQGTSADIYRQIGNAVPPVVAEAVARGFDFGSRRS